MKCSPQIFTREPEKCFTTIHFFETRHYSQFASHAFYIPQCFMVHKKKPFAKMASCNLPSKGRKSRSGVKFLRCSTTGFRRVLSLLPSENIYFISLASCSMCKKPAQLVPRPPSSSAAQYAANQNFRTIVLRDLESLRAFVESRKHPIDPKISSQNGFETNRPKGNGGLFIAACAMHCCCHHA